MKRTIQRLLGIAALAVAAIGGSFVAATTAQAQTVPTCTYYHNGTAYPSVTAPTGPTYFAVCVPNVVAARRDEAFNAISLLPRKTQSANPNEVRDVLQLAQVNYFYFADRAAGNAWFSSNNYPAIFQDPSGRCGNTVGSPLSGLITVAIYDRCTYANNVQGNNTSLKRTTLHESGHAFALAIAKNAGNIANSPDASTGWKALMTDGINKLTPAGWIAPWSDANRASYLCNNVFGNYAPSALELDLGSTSNPVCSGGNPVDPTFAKNPRQLAEDKAPYFVRNNNGVPTNNSNKEIWAELFTIRHDTAGSPAMFLQLTDSMLGYGSYTSSTANFQCLKLVMQFYYTDVVPPTSADLTARGCPANPGSFVTH